MSNYSQVWNLPPVTIEALKKFREEIHTLPSSIKEALSKIQEWDAHCHAFESLVLSLLSENVNNTKALQLHSLLVSIRTTLEMLHSELFEKIAALSENEFASLLEEIPPIAFHLKEKRDWAKEHLTISQEKLIQRLSMNGYQGWNDLYSHLMGTLTIPLNDKEDAERLSVGQADNQLSHPSRPIRQAMFRQWEKAFEAREGTFAQILNNLAGFRLETYQARGWKNILKEPLHENRLQEQTLHCMWEVIGKSKGILNEYLAKKAEILNLKKLSWYDIDASLPSSEPFYLPYEEAAALIIQEFNAFSPLMGAFAEKAFKSKWIEAEDRAGKRPGGYCAHLPTTQESRIFMTYHGTMANVFTLAHELGHAYHNHVVDPLPRFSQTYKMNVAETASTLAECVLIDAFIKNATAASKKIFLEFKIQRAVLFLMNIHSRFLFETRFYAERQKGYVLPSRLNEIMLEAQKEAFCDALEEWHPHFWTSKLHFYFTEVPFYNFPYTFGYLFSFGTYKKLLQMPEKGIAYENLLKDTGQMTTEGLAAKHLGVNLIETRFWEETIRHIEDEVKQLLNYY